MGPVFFEEGRGHRSFRRFAQKCLLMPVFLASRAGVARFAQQDVVFRRVVQMVVVDMMKFELHAGTAASCAASPLLLV